MCRQAGFLLSPDSPALAKNWRPGSELPEPPWFTADGEVIDYIGACPEVKQETAQQVPEAPSNIEVERP